MKFSFIILYTFVYNIFSFNINNVNNIKKTNIFYHLFNKKNINNLKINNNNNNNNIIEKTNITSNNHHHWYVIGEKNEFISNKLYKKTIWNKDYVIWKDNISYYAMDNYCSHRGASLVKGKIINKNIVCPYHGYEFNNSGILTHVPGLNFTNNKCQNMKTYQIKEKNGWVYLNINATIQEAEVPIYEEPEAKNMNCTCNFLNLPFKSYARLISENSLDVMHIVYVHSFGNIQVPSPIYENPPKLQDDYPNHYKTEYIYVSGNDSIAKKIFNSSFLNVDVEFILPNTQIVRIKFDKYISTIITAVTPINMTCSQIFMKSYRSYWYKPNATNLFDIFYNHIFNQFTNKIMMDTILQDKKVVENINPKYMEGNYNMKYDKPGNLYRQLYKKIVHEWNDFFYK
jgi:phenylpropionate dioxygenase-like ring-hydroxylating dioxygenase large terminal subunit